MEDSNYNLVEDTGQYWQSPSFISIYLMARQRDILLKLAIIPTPDPQTSSTYFKHAKAPFKRYQTHGKLVIEALRCYKYLLMFTESHVVSKSRQKYLKYTIVPVRSTHILRILGVQEEILYIVGVNYLK